MRNFVCSGWRRDGNGALYKKTCTLAEKKDHDKRRNVDCCVLDARRSKAEAEATLKIMEEQAAERRRLKEGIEEELSMEETKDDRRFLDELNHGRRIADR